MVTSETISHVQLGDHLGFAGILVGLVGIALTILWPTKRWVGFLCLLAAVVLGILWGGMAYESWRHPSAEGLNPKTVSPSDSPQLGPPPPQFTSGKQPQNGSTASPSPGAPTPSGPSRQFSAPPKAELQVPPALTPLFYDKDRLRLTIQNVGGEAATQPKFTFGLANLSSQFLADYDGTGTTKPEPLPIPTQKLDDFVRPNESLGAIIVINDLSKPFVKQGDRLFGQFILTCMNCDHQRDYWLYWQVGVGGWWAEVPPTQKASVPFIQNPHMTDEEIVKAISDFVPIRNRIAIFSDLDALEAARGRARDRARQKP